MLGWRLLVSVLNTVHLLVSAILLTASIMSFFGDKSSTSSSSSTMAPMSPMPTMPSLLRQQCDCYLAIAPRWTPDTFASTTAVSREQEQEYAARCVGYDIGDKKDFLDKFKKDLDAKAEGTQAITGFKKANLMKDPAHTHKNPLMPSIEKFWETHDDDRGPVDKAAKKLLSYSIDCADTYKIEATTPKPEASPDPTTTSDPEATVDDEKYALVILIVLIVNLLATIISFVGVCCVRKWFMQLPLIVIAALCTATFGYIVFHLIKKEAWTLVYVALGGFVWCLIHLVLLIVLLVMQMKQNKEEDGGSRNSKKSKKGKKGGKDKKSKKKKDSDDDEGSKMSTTSSGSSQA